jgi:phosphatidate cytidylyltransferase
MLKKRVITGLWGIPLLIACVWFSMPEYPFPLFTALVAIWGVLAAFEFYNIAGAKIAPLTYLGMLWTLLFIISPHFNDAFLRLTGQPLVPLLLASGVMISLIWLLGRPKKEGAFIGWAWTIAGMLYIGWLLSHFVALRGLEDGRNWVFFALFVTFASDTTAFFVGRALGRHKLAPKVSPGKTWEGTIAGVLGAIVISLIFVPSHFFTWSNPLYLEHLCYWSAILGGILVSTFGQLGDLVESLLKRNMGVKDSSKIIPGHGGFLDRIDSVVFAGVVVYYYVIWVIQSV